MRWPVGRTPPENHAPVGYALRLYREGDQAAYLDLMRRSGLAEWTVPELEGLLPGTLSQGFFVIEHGASGALAATAQARRSFHAAHPGGSEIGWVAADPDHAGRGLGLIVTSAAVRRSLALGYVDVFLLTDDWRTPAIRTYLRMGFEPIVEDDDARGRWATIRDGLVADRTATPR
ncbi:MAG: GNAT family N-acetyltransferase [Fimbriimonadaceae bacterium]|nr:GNAT family N-acetyltransferase [Fimbriimonadaceae bacterium]